MMVKNTFLEVRSDIDHVADDLAAASWQAKRRRAARTCPDHRPASDEPEEEAAPEPVPGMPPPVAWPRTGGGPAVAAAAAAARNPRLLGSPTTRGARAGAAGSGPPQPALHGFSCKVSVKNTFLMLEEEEGEDLMPDHGRRATCPANVHPFDEEVQEEQGSEELARSADAAAAAAGAAAAVSASAQMPHPYNPCYVRYPVSQDRQEMRGLRRPSGGRSPATAAGPRAALRLPAGAIAQDDDTFAAVDEHADQEALSTPWATTPYRPGSRHRRFDTQDLRESLLASELSQQAGLPAVGAAADMQDLPRQATPGPHWAAQPTRAAGRLHGFDTQDLRESLLADAQGAPTKAGSRRVSFAFDAEESAGQSAQAPGRFGSARDAYNRHPAGPPLSAAPTAYPPAPMLHPWAAAAAAASPYAVSYAAQLLALGAHLGPALFGAAPQLLPMPTAEVVALWPSPTHAHAAAAAYGWPVGPAMAAPLPPPPPPPAARWVQEPLAAPGAWGACAAPAAPAAPAVWPPGLQQTVPLWTSTRRPASNPLDPISPASSGAFGEAQQAPAASAALRAVLRQQRRRNQACEAGEAAPTAVAPQPGAYMAAPARRADTVDTWQSATLAPRKAVPFTAPEEGLAAMGPPSVPGTSEQELDIASDANAAGKVLGNPGRGGHTGPRRLRLWAHIYLHMQVPGFDLVPRMIGRGGCNMRKIAEQTGAKVRIRGRGSGHLEIDGKAEAPTPLMVAVTTDHEDPEGFRAAISMIMKELKTVEGRYRAFIQKQNCVHEGPCYSVGLLSDGATRVLTGVLDGLAWR